MVSLRKAKPQKKKNGKLIKSFRGNGCPLVSYGTFMEQEGVSKVVNVGVMVSIS